MVKLIPTMASITNFFRSLCVNKGEDTPLMQATIDHDCETARTLILAGADIHVRNKEGLYARELIDVTIDAPMARVHDFFPRLKAIHDAFQNTVLAGDGPSFVDFKRRQGAGIVNQIAMYAGEYPELTRIDLRRAMLKKDSGCLLECLQERVIDTNCMAQDTADIIFYLMDHDADRAKNTLQILLANGLDPNYQDENSGYSFLHKASSKGLKELVNMLVDAKANVDVQSYNNTTPLHHAVIKEKDEIVERLVSLKASLDLQGSSQKITALSFAMSHENLTNFKTLIGAKADLKVKDKEGKTVLAKAAFNASQGKLPKEILQMLIDAKGDINTQDENGVTPFEYAIRAGNIGIMNQILDANPDVGLKNNKGERLVDIAKQKLCELLEKKNTLQANLKKHECGTSSLS